MSRDPEQWREEVNRAAALRQAIRTAADLCADAQLPEIWHREALDECEDALDVALRRADEAIGNGFRDFDWIAAP